MSMQRTANHRHPLALWVLLGMLVFLSIGASYGGISLIADPTGGLLNAPQDALAGSPFETYLIPGWILFTVLGVFPLFTAYGILRRPNIAAMARIEQLTRMHWAWLSSVTVGAALVIWMVVQAWMIGFGAAIQWAYLALGIAIVATTMVPSLRTSFSLDGRRSSRARRVPGERHAKS